MTHKASSKRVVKPPTLQSRYIQSFRITILRSTGFEDGPFAPECAQSLPERHRLLVYEASHHRRLHLKIAVDMVWRCYFVQTSHIHDEGLFLPVNHRFPCNRSGWFTVTTDSIAADFVKRNERRAWSVGAGIDDAPFRHNISDVAAVKFTLGIVAHHVEFSGTESMAAKLL